MKHFWIPLVTSTVWYYKLKVIYTCPNYLILKKNFFIQDVMKRIRKNLRFLFKFIVFGVIIINTYQIKIIKKHLETRFQIKFVNNFNLFCRLFLLNKSEL